MNNVQTYLFPSLANLRCTHSDRQMYHWGHMYPSFRTLVLHAFQFANNFNSAVTFFILYNTLDVPLSANSAVTLLVNTRG